MLMVKSHMNSVERFRGILFKMRSTLGMCVMYDALIALRNPTASAKQRADTSERTNRPNCTLEAGGRDTQQERSTQIETQFHTVGPQRGTIFCTTATRAFFLCFRNHVRNFTIHEEIQNKPERNGKYNRGTCGCTFVCVWRC